MTTWQLLHLHSCSNGNRSKSYPICTPPALPAPMSTTGQLDTKQAIQPAPSVLPSRVRCFDYAYAADCSWVSRQPLATCRARSTCMARTSVRSWAAYLPQPDDPIYGRHSPVRPLFRSLPLRHPLPHLRRQESCRDATHYEGTQRR